MMIIELWRMLYKLSKFLFCIGKYQCYLHCLNNLRHIKDMSVLINNVYHRYILPLKMFVHNVYEHVVNIITNINDIAWHSSWYRLSILESSMFKLSKSLNILQVEVISKTTHNNPKSFQHALKLIRKRKQNTN